jgi:hypothetical protein
MRALAAHSTVLKNTSDMVRHSLQMKAMAASPVKPITSSIKLSLVIFTKRRILPCPST